MPNRSSRLAPPLRAALTAVLTSTLTATACSGADPTDRPTGTPGWSRVSLPAGDQPVVLTASGGRMLIGLRRPGARPVPRLLLQTPDGRTQPVGLSPRSPYAYEATWESIVTDGRAILAVGGAPGGAHANTRWTVWAGSTAHLTEIPQSFNTFGGWGAGQLLDMVTTSAGSVLVGSWANARSGMDVAVWLPAGSRWIRQDPTGTALQSTERLQVGPRAATVAGAGVVVVGSLLRLEPGSVSQHAVLWRSRRLNEGWARLELPDPGSRSEAMAARCAPASCVVSGQVDGRLALWTLDGAGARRLPDVPPITPGDKDRLLAPFEVDGHRVQLVTDADRVRVLAERAGEWTVRDGPAGAVVDAALVGHRLSAIVRAPDGTTSLWSTVLADG